MDRLLAGLAAVAPDSHPLQRIAALAAGGEPLRLLPYICRFGTTSPVLWCPLAACASCPLQDFSDRVCVSDCRPAQPTVGAAVAEPGPGALRASPRCRRTHQWAVAVGAAGIVDGSACGADAAAGGPTRACGWCIRGHGDARRRLGRRQWLLWHRAQPGGSEPG
jgi:hypothetical protein